MAIPKEFIEYAPVILIITIFLANYKIFVTPTQLSDTEKAINKSIEEKLQRQEDKFATKEIVNSLKCDFEDVKKKIDKIYDFILTGKINND